MDELKINLNLKSSMFFPGLKLSCTALGTWAPLWTPLLQAKGDRNEPGPQATASE